MNDIMKKIKANQSTVPPIRYIAENALGDVQFIGSTKKEAMEAYFTALKCQPVRVLAVLIEDGPAAWCSLENIKQETPVENSSVSSEPVVQES